MVPLSDPVPPPSYHDDDDVDGGDDALVVVVAAAAAATTTTTTPTTPRLILPDSSRLVREDVEVHQVPTSGYTEFDQVCGGTDKSRLIPSFLSFETAYHFGKLVAKRLGFRMRIK